MRFCILIVIIILLISYLANKRDQQEAQQISDAQVREFRSEVERGRGRLDNSRLDTRGLQTPAGRGRSATNSDSDRR